MSDDDLVLRRSVKSSRVRRVLAAAIRCVVSRETGQRLGDQQSEWLARSYTPKEAVLAFRAQSNVRRTGLDPQSEVVARAWIVARDGIVKGFGAEVLPQGSDEGRGDAVDERMQFDQVIRRLRRVQDARVSATEDQVRAAEASVEALGDRFRRFVRRADRLWHQQQSWLRMAVLDDEQYGRAVQELGAVYLKCFKEASEFPNINH